MDNIRADKFGYDAFQIKCDGKIHKVYKVGWYISGVGESYVLCLFYWKPKGKRARFKKSVGLKEALRNHEDPDLVIPINSGRWCEYDDKYINKIIKSLKLTGKIDLDRLKRL